MSRRLLKNTPLLLAIGAGLFMLLRAQAERREVAREYDRLVEVETTLKQVEQLLATAGELPSEVEQAVEKLLNMVEELCVDRQSLAAEVG